MLSFLIFVKGMHIKNGVVDCKIEYWIAKSSQILVIIVCIPLCNMILFLASVTLPSLNSFLGYVTCFGQGDINKFDTNRGFIM